MGNTLRSTLQEDKTIFSKLAEDIERHRKDWSSERYLKISRRFDFIVEKAEEIAMEAKDYLESGKEKKFLEQVERMEHFLCCLEELLSVMKQPTMTNRSFRSSIEKSLKIQDSMLTLLNSVHSIVYPHFRFYFDVRAEPSLFFG